MNTYQLFTEDDKQWFVQASSAGLAIHHLESTLRAGRIVCWFLPARIPANATVLHP